MLKREEEGEKEPWRGLRGSLWNLCTQGLFLKNVEAVKKMAKSCHISAGRGLSIWAQAGRPDVTTDDGHRYMQQKMKEARKIENGEEEHA